MGKLDLHIRNVDETNNGLILGLPDKDIISAANNVGNAITQIMSPINVATENLIDTVRDSINNILNTKVKNGSYKKLIKFVPATIL